MAISLAYLKLSKNKKILYKAGWCDENGNLTDKGSEVLEMINFEEQETKMVELAQQVNKELKDEFSKKN